jgi:periplasmic copper chaperone A
MNWSSVSLPRPVSRLALVAAFATGLVAVGSGTASAHVSVASTDAAPGGFGKMTFRVPNESDTASTVSLRIQIPPEAAMASLRVQPVPGWTATTTTAELPEPLEAHGQEISTYVSVVEFRAADGGGIRPGEFQEFALSGGPFPEADSLAFPAVQGYSDGSEAAWIEPTVDGQEEPERPAPVLTLARETTATAGEQATAPTTEPATEEHGHASATDEPGALALFVAFLALLAGIGGVVLGVRANRRTVSS